MVHVTCCLQEFFFPLQVVFGPLVRFLVPCLVEKERVQVPPRKAVGANPPYMIVTFDGDFDADGNVPKLGVACKFVFRSLTQMYK